MAKKSNRPPKALIGGVWHELVLFLVKDTDGENVPCNCRMVTNEETVKIAEGMEFMTAYVPRVMLHNREKK